MELVDTKITTPLLLARTLRIRERRSSDKSMIASYYSKKDDPTYEGYTGKKPSRLSVLKAYS